MTTQNDPTHTESKQLDAIDAFSSASALLEALHERRISATELLELYLRRIQRYNPQLNAIVVLDEQARQNAAKADEMRARGKRKPLLGLPITIKDSIDVAGLPGTMGI